MHKRIGAVSVLAVFICAGVAGAAGEVKSFYKGPAVFSTRPSETKSQQTIARFGPVGMAIELHQPAFVMKVGKIEEGSPAATAGKLKAGQIIETINGRKLADIDPRIQLGRIITAAEASDGKVKFMVKDTPGDKAQQVIVNIPVLGKYSPTWPLKCAKSDKIVRNFADYMAKPGTDPGFGGIGMLFLVSTGDDKDLVTVRKWARGLGTATYAWHLGYGGIPLCEYYLRTGDQSVLPVIQRWADSATKGEFFGGWAGRGGVAGVNYGGGGGHLNAGGTAVVTFLLLAKECGVKVNDDTLHRVLRHFYRYAGRGNNPYGNGRTEVAFVDNGKNGNLAFAMAAAASLTPDGEKSIYAAARDACAMTGFYTTTFMLHGHTGGGIGEIWRSAAMGLLRDKKPTQYREFMDNRQWHYELSRRWDGSFGILGGAGYDKVSWGAGYPLAYTIPRKTLRITGAPPSKFSKKYKLPKRPWGTEADDLFVSLQAPADKNGNRQDLSKEKLASDSAKQILERMAASDELSDAVISKYAHHQDHAVRIAAARKAMGINTNQVGWRLPGGKPRLELAVELIKSKDPRVRQAVLYAINKDYPGDKILTPEVFGLLIKMAGDPAESWWVKDAALNLIGRASADMIAPHVDLLVGFLKHEEWWLQNSALTALAPVAGDERCYRKVVPAVGELLRTCQIWNATAGTISRINAKLNTGSPAVRKLAAQEFKSAYIGYTGVKTAPGGQNVISNFDSHMEFLAQSLAGVPGGYDVLYKIAKEKFPNKALPYAKIFLAADPEKFGPELKKAIMPIIQEKVIYEFIGKNRRTLLAEAAPTKSRVHLKGRVDELADLYRKVGVQDYNWHSFGPDLKNAKWDYHTFEPQEKKKYDISPWRYRKVTYPAGMENWFATDFDPAKAGWKKGLAPFGQYNGKLVTTPRSCSNLDCGHSDPMRTFWDKEVLLLRKTFKCPALKPGHLYRIRVGAGQHVGSGAGFSIYINGKQMSEAKEGNGRRTGGRPRGAYVTKDFVEEFNKGEVTIAAITFLRYGNKAIVKMPPIAQGIFRIWLEEMKFPTVDDAAIRKSAAVIPMLSSKWQETKEDGDKYLYDGKPVANAQLMGTWKSVAQVKTIGEFDPAKKTSPGRTPFTTVTFKDKGMTSDGLWIWSGDTLMDLSKYQALKMQVRKIGGADYLFIETGGFSTRNKPDWKPQLCVMKRK
ncbi:MAG: hypothetical protein HN350_01590 [Phycisphaerales bacterium]|jgi:hypothetical protein|nr:hypothetical protein [Phycisphaerales bacterium]